MEIRKLICIGCPKGCHLDVEMNGENVVSVKGNTCPIGKTYGEKECTNPTRMITSTLKLKDGTIDMVPVKTSSDVPKGKIFDIVKSLKGCIVEAPVKVGQVLAENVGGTGVDIVATRTIEHI